MARSLVNRQSVVEQLDRRRMVSELEVAGFRTFIEGTDTPYIVAGMTF